MPAATEEHRTGVTQSMGATEYCNLIGAATVLDGGGTRSQEIGAIPSIDCGCGAVLARTSALVLIFHVYVS